MAHTARGSNLTIDHAFIRRWTEERGGRPACGGGSIRLEFPGYDEGALEELGWDEWFRRFDASNLALLYQDVTRDGQKSTFNKLVSRDQLREADERYQGGAD